MKLIIDVPDNVYAKVMEYYEHNGIVEAVYGYIYRGIPFEQITADIAQKLDNPHEYIVKQDAYNEIVDIINSYIKVGAPQDVIS